MVTVESTIALFTLLQLIKDPAKHEAAMSSLAAARDTVVAEQAKLSDLQAKRDVLNEDRRVFEKEQQEVAASKAALAAQREVLEKAKAELAASVGAYATERANLKQSIAKHESDLAELAVFK